MTFERPSYLWERPPYQWERDLHPRRNTGDPRGNPTPGREDLVPWWCLRDPERDPGRDPGGPDIAVRAVRA